MDNKKCSDCGSTKTIANYSHDFNSDVCNGCQNIADTAKLTREQRHRKKLCSSSGNHSPMVKDFIRPSGKRRDGALRENKTCNYCDAMNQARVAKRKANPKPKLEKGQHHTPVSHGFDEKDLMATTPLGFLMLSRPIINTQTLRLD